ncbi:uncharacterized protein LOC119885027 [Micropterus salmoides]|uniref:uncharacterized protein LOC119885027 n=1 Tax=Micropterus salmoides TaxID=27706 RepID=UPI0018EBA112|nr:uncharacterized protein LOC119885027 [Micropterus salmoides]
MPVKLKGEVDYARSGTINPLNSSPFTPKPVVGCDMWHLRVQSNNSDGNIFAQKSACVLRLSSNPRGIRLSLKHKDNTATQRGSDISYCPWVVGQVKYKMEQRKRKAPSPFSAGSDAGSCEMTGDSPQEEKEEGCASENSCKETDAPLYCIAAAACTKSWTTEPQSEPLDLSLAGPRCAENTSEVRKRATGVVPMQPDSEPEEEPCGGIRSHEITALLAGDSSHFPPPLSLMSSTENNFTGAESLSGGSCAMLELPGKLLRDIPVVTLPETGLIKNSSAADSMPGVSQDNTREIIPHATAGPSSLQLSNNDDEDSDTDRVVFYSRKQQCDESSGSTDSFTFIHTPIAIYSELENEYGDAHFLRLASQASEQILQLPNNKDTDDSGPRFSNSSFTVRPQNRPSVIKKNKLGDDSVVLEEMASSSASASRFRSLHDDDSRRESRKVTIPLLPPLPLPPPNTQDTSSKVI